jgi:hypothetical protein
VAATIRVELTPGAVERLLKSPEMARLLRDMGDEIARAAGPGHKVTVEIGPNRARVEVVTDTIDAKLAEARSRNLTRAIGAGRR